jgi:hypothetical protein
VRAKAYGRRSPSTGMDRLARTRPGVVRDVSPIWRGVARSGSLSGDILRRQLQGRSSWTRLASSDGVRCVGGDLHCSRQHLTPGRSSPSSENQDRSAISWSGVASIRALIQAGAAPPLSSRSSLSSGSSWLCAPPMALGHTDLPRSRRGRQDADFTGMGADRP